MAGESTEAVRSSRRFPLRGLSVVVLVAFAVVAGGLFVAAERLFADQEGRLLDERTAEVGALLSSSVATGLQSSLISLSVAAQQPSGSFARAAEPLLSPGGAIVVVARRGPDWVVQTAVGSLPRGLRLTGPRRALVEATRGKLHSDVFAVPGGTSRLGVALGPPVAAAGTVVYLESVVDPAKPTPVTRSQPFHELRAALYVGRRAEPGRLILATTSELPLRGRTGQSLVTVGDGSWLVVAAARQPLAGGVAAGVPAILLLATLLIGVVMTVLVESVGRRRDYALGLVTQRTQALQESLAELRATQQALVDSERLAALGEMAATVGHELRNPLGVLTNSMFLIRNGVAAEAGEKVRRQLDTADREIAAATLIVSDLLEFSRPRLANPTPVDIADLIQEAATVAPPPVGADVERDLQPMPPVVADRDQLRQVVLNLLTNAYEAMPEGGTVRIGAHVVDDAVEIAVSDTGVGMDSQTREQVFEPFFSLKVKGTGLGLAVSKRIVEAHCGTLTMESEPGHGCTATIRLPLEETAAGVGR